MQLEQTENTEMLESSRVLSYLKLNPDFFNQHAEILPNLRIPHDTGGAVSLIEKQLSVIRGKCSALEFKLGELISVAQENEQLHHRMHHLTQEIISANSIEEVVAISRESLVRDFKADDDVKFILIDDRQGLRVQRNPQLFVRYDEPALSHFESTLSGRETTCGEPDFAQRAYLFNGADRVRSMATIPLQHNRDLGLVVLSSVDEQRFHRSKGVMFLTQLGEVLSRRIHSLL